MKKIFLLSILLLPVSIFSQYFSGAAGYYKYADDNSTAHYYGVLGGNFHLTLSDGPTSVIHHNNPLLYGNISSAVIELPEGSIDFMVGPVPADDRITMMAEYHKELTFFLHNFNGIQVRVIKGVPSEGIEIRTSGLPSGMYFLHVIENQHRKIQSLPIIINH